MFALNRRLLFTILLETLYTFYLQLIIIFGVIYLYGLYKNILIAVAPFALGHLAYSFLIPFTMQIVGKIGTRLGLLISLAFFGLTSFANIVGDLHNPHFNIVLFFSLFFAAKTFFHPAVGYYYSKYTTPEARGKQLALKKVFSIPLAVITPFLGALILGSFGFAGIGIVGGGVILLGIVPVLLLENLKFDTQFSFKLFNLKEPVSEIFNLNLLTEIVYSANRIWPLYIFILFGNSLIELGGLVSITTGLAISVVFILGVILDRIDKRRFHKYLFAGYSYAWLLKLLTVTPLLTAIADFIDRFFHMLVTQSQDTVNNDLINKDLTEKDRDERVLLREIACNLGIAAGILFTGFIAEVFGIYWVFLVIGLLGLLISRTLGKQTI